MKYSFLIAVAAMSFLTFHFPALGQSDQRPRVIATTDGEIDDRCSMVRFLLYANDLDIKGIVHSSSRFHWKGGGDDPGEKWHPVTWLDKHLKAYAEVYPNLVKHDKNYPSPEYLNKQVFIGNINHVGDMKEETPGSNRIVEVLLEDDPSPVWLQAWGGANTISRAFKTIEEKYPEKKAEVARKAKLFLIIKQDSTFDNYIRPNWPTVEVIISTSGFEAIGYPWQKRIPESYKETLLSDWMSNNILDDHGPLTRLYEALKDKKFRSEGDSPSFMQQIPNGLRGDEHPSYGGWGGRFQWNEKGHFWESALEDADKYKSVYRWIPAFQNDWAARADWCVREYKDANHPPVVKINRNENLTAKPGELVKINAKKSSDPDKDKLSFRWWQYDEADTFKGLVRLQETENKKMSFTVPSDAVHGDTIHLICEVMDAGTPALTRYKRIIVTVEEF